MQWSYALGNIQLIAKEFWIANKGKTVFAFHGPMGAGKTTFIHALCCEKGVKDVVGSPTFSLINEYEYFSEGTPKALFHLDLYRLKDEEEAARAGIEDVLYSGNICLAEWPDKALRLFPEDTVHVFFEITGIKERLIKIVNN